MKNIAIYGGSFDPPSVGHMMLISHLLLNDASIDEIWVVPCFMQSGKTLTSFAHRMVMAQLAFGVFNRVKVSEIESDLGGESLTYRTIQTFSVKYPDYRFRFIIGADLEESIKSWEGADIIQRLAPPLVIGRAGISNSSNATPISPLVSSTIIRKALDEGRTEDAERYLSAAVLKYIVRNKLYARNVQQSDNAW